MAQLIRRRTVNAASTSDELREELDAALSHPNEIFGYAKYGWDKDWRQLNKMTGGIQPKSLSILAARPKRGKSMLAAAWVPQVAEQAMSEDKVVRVVTLEMQRKSYQRRMAAIMAGIPNPMNIRRGTLDKQEQKRYLRALDELSILPIEYLSNEVDLTEEEALKLGNSPVSYDEVSSFIRGRMGGGETYWWVLDHIGLLTDLSTYGDVTTSVYSLANRLAGLSHTVATGLVITHLNRASAGSVPTIESIAGSDQVGKNADQIFLLSRPFMDVPNLEEKDQKLIEDGEPAFLQFYSRDEGSGVDILWWQSKYATFKEIDWPEGKEIPMPKRPRSGRERNEDRTTSAKGGG